MQLTIHSCFDLQPNTFPSVADLCDNQASDMRPRIPGDVYYTRDFHCYVRRVDGTQWYQKFSLMSEANKDHFTFGMVYQKVAQLMELPNDHTLVIDDTKHSFNPLPSSLNENQIGWYLKEVPS